MVLFSSFARVAAIVRLVPSLPSESFTTSRAFSGPLFASLTSPGGSVSSADAFWACAGPAASRTPRTPAAVPALIMARLLFFFRWEDRARNRRQVTGLGGGGVVAALLRERRVRRQEHADH